MVLLAAGRLLGAEDGTVNVKDFGAKGDGATDDTAAIVAAAHAARINLSEPSPVGGYFQSGPVLVFPNGKYMISGEIPLNVLEVRGQGRAILFQTDQAKRILVCDNVWRLAIRNLTFSGGKNQIDLRNVNTDTGQIIVDHCRFYGATGFGVYTDVLSTTVKITDCEFIRCRQTWHNGRSDQAVMRDCWVYSSSEAQNQAVIEHRGGTLTLENIVGVPDPRAKNPRWVDNYGSILICRSFRFGGEGGGFTPVHNYAKYSDSLWGKSIVIEDCLVFANASYSANCAVYCYEVPNSIRISNSTLAGAAAVMVDPSLDLKRYFQARSPDMFSFQVDGCTGEVMSGLPKGLQRPVVNPPPPPAGMLSAKETATALARARKALAARTEEPASPCETGGHRQRVEAGSYVDLTDWSASGYMDATSQPNRDWLALQKAGTDVIVLFRQPQPGGWPHITIRGSVDLDKYPFLTWRQKPGTAPGAFAVKVLDVAAGNVVTLHTETQSNEYDYYAHNLKERLGLGGIRQIEVRFYAIGWGWQYPSAKAGEYDVLDFMRMEAESRN
jgi:hypothetical protein